MDFPIEHGGSFHNYVSPFTRGNPWVFNHQKHPTKGRASSPASRWMIPGDQGADLFQHLGKLLSGSEERCETWDGGLGWLLSHDGSMVLVYVLTFGVY